MLNPVQMAKKNAAEAVIETAEQEARRLKALHPYNRDIVPALDRKREATRLLKTVEHQAQNNNNLGPARQLF
jgi:hypothetical protein